MTELISLFNKLSEFYDRSLIWENIEELYEKAAENRTAKSTQKPTNTNNDNDASSDDETLATVRTNLETGQGVTALPSIRRALNDTQVLSTLLELCTTIRQLRESGKSYDNTYDCWDQVVKVSPRDSYLAFIYALAGLVTLDATNAQYTRLAVAAANTYFLSLTIPGAKGFHIFEEEIIAHVLQVFVLIEKVQNPDVLRRMSRQQSIEIWVNFATFCDDLKLLLRYVHFNDYKTARDRILRKLIDVQFLNHERGYANLYAANLHAKCFEIFEEMINAHNGDPEETLMKLMNMTVFLHTYAPKPKAQSSQGFGSASSIDCEHISDWFIKCIAKYPRILTKVLSFYIECIVTNPVKTWKTEQTLRALEYAAKYDAALFTKCNVSSVEFLCDAVYAEEVMIRSRAIELISRILLLESKVDWQMFRHEVSNIPRELHLIKELIDSLKDNNNNIKLKAVQALQMAVTRGSPNAQTILTECLQYADFNDSNVVLPAEPRVSKNEIRYGKPQARTPAYSFEGVGLIELSFLNLPELIYTHLFQNPLSYIRRAGIMFIEQIVKINPLVIFNTNFVAETSRLVDEPTALVRKQTLIMVDGILSCYPNCFPLIWVWCKIVSPMLHDGDPKNIDLAIDCFRSKVLSNMKGIDQSNKAEHFMPWVIIRTMLSTQSRLYLQTCFHLALQQRMLNAQILSTIESHLLTGNSTEAWIVLNFVSGKYKSKEPDSLIHLFTSLKSWNKEQNILIALEVLGNCIQDFSHSALNFAFDHILKSIRDGSMLPVIIGKAFDFLLLIDNCSNVQSFPPAPKSNKGSHTSTADKDWIVELHSFLEFRILDGIEDFPDNRSTFMSYLYSYSEVNLQTRLRPNSTIINFVHKYVNECLKLPEFELDLDNERLFNSMILIAGRLSLRDACVASTTCRLYGAILRIIDRPPIVNTIIIAVTDLCKKHTQIVERIIERLLRKLQSPYVVNRIEMFKCFERLVLQDQLKLRGSLLLALMTAILDESPELATRACEFFAEFLSKKNPTLFQKCLIECPFVLNEYKNFDGLDSFSENTIKSPLLGEAKRKQRQQLYNHLMTDMDDINMVLYFGQLKLIAEKSKHDPLIKSAEGIALVRDVLYILRRVCQICKEQKTAGDAKDAADNNGDDEMAAEIAELTATAEDNQAGTASDAKAKGGTLSGATGVGRGRGRRREVTTMADALTLLEKSLAFLPIIYRNTHSLDATVVKSFDELGHALAKRFPNLIEYAQPAEFWNKYRKTKKMTPKKRKGGKKRKSNGITQGGDEQSSDDSDKESDVDGDAENDDSNSDDDLPLASITPAKRLRAPNRTELQMEYLFNPNIVL